jgi:arginine decarboxylase
VLPALVDAHPHAYREMGLRDLAAAMHAEMRATRVLECMDQAFMLLPDVVLSPHATYNQLVKRNVEKIPVSAMVERTISVQLVPYPPGIPIMMPGERVTAQKRAVVDYLLALQNFDRRFPGFEHDTHGIEVERDRDGAPIYMTRCLKA